MNDNDTTESFVSDSRRSILKAGALAAASLGVGGAATGTTTAQEDGDVGVIGDDDATGSEELFVENEASTGAIYRQAWIPSGMFTIASPVIDFTPEAPGISDNFFDSYNTRIARYVGTNQNFLFFPQDNATIGPYEEELGYVVDDDFVEGDQVVVDGTPIDELSEEQMRQIRPTIWIFSRNNQFFSGDSYVLSVDFSPIPENQEEQIYSQVQEDFDVGGGGGTPDGTSTPTPTPSGGN